MRYDADMGSPLPTPRPTEPGHGSADSGNRAPASSSPNAADAALSWMSLPAMRHPNAYVWLLFFSAMDVMLTWAILSRGGREVNPIANEVITAWGLNGAITFKFSLMLLVVIVCEVVARSRATLARSLAWAAVIISAVPVFYSLALLLLHTIEHAR